ncbi:MAG: SRPBCC domain-containing protein [Bradyrhizobium sp.]|uniref:SRPBCC domain-containing protein n=1 Tax=Bradyrhizobium sp. TaxID=376 RepID=UPI003D1057C3
MGRRIATGWRSTRLFELLPQKRIVQAFEFASPDPAFAGTMTMRWALEPTEDGTLVTVAAENVPAGIDQADHEDGMRSSLAKLAAYVE